MRNWQNINLNKIISGNFRQKVMIRKFEIWYIKYNLFSNRPANKRNQQLTTSTDMDSKKQSNASNIHQYSKHSFNLSQSTNVGHVPQYSADSQLASSQGVHFKLTSNHPQTTSGSSSLFSGTEHTHQGQHPYQQYGRDADMPYHYTDQKTERDKINIENYGEDMMMQESGELFQPNVVQAPVSGVMSLESQPSAHFYQPNQQSLPTERYNPVINVQVGATGSQSLSQTGTSVEEQPAMQPFSFHAKGSSAIKMTKKLKDRKHSMQQQHNLDISPTLGPSSMPTRESERNKRSGTEMAGELPDLSQTTMNDQSQVDNYHTIGDVSGMITARSNNGLKRGPTTIGQKVGIKIICRIAPTKALSRNQQQNQGSRQSLSSSRPSSSKVAVNAGQHIYMDVGRHMESPAATDKKLGNAHQSIRSTANYLYSQVSSPSAAGTIGRSKQGFRAASIDSQQNSDRHRLFHGTGKSMNSDKRGPKRGGSHLRNMQSKDSLIASGAFKYTQSKLLNEEGYYCIFSTRNQSRFVLACDQSFQGKVLNETFNDIEDIQQLQKSQQNSLGDGTAPSQPVIFKFDAVHDETLAGRQDKIYKQNVQPIIHNFIEGQNGTVLLFGPSASGKTYTLKGGQGSERGIVPRAVDEILQLIKGADQRELDKTPTFLNQNCSPQNENKIFLKASIYMITSQKIVDLIAKKGKYSSFANSSKEREKGPHLQHYFDQQQNAVMSQVMDLNERLILCPEDFYIALADAFRARKDLSLSEYRDKDIRKKSHFIIAFQLMQQHAAGKFMQISQLNFVELSGSEQAVIQGGSTSQYDQIRDKTTQQFVSKSFNSLSCHLMKLVQRKKNMQANLKPGANNVLGSGDDEESKLVACLRQTLTIQSNVLLVNCVEPSPFMIEHSLPSLKFCSSLREHIKKKMKRMPKEKTKAQKSGQRPRSKPQSKSRSRSKSKNKEGTANSKSGRKKNNSISAQQTQQMDWSKAIEGKIDSLKINLINQEQQLENGLKDAMIIQKLGDLLLESQALQKEVENQQASGNFKDQDVEWAQFTSSISYLHNKILRIICIYSQQQQMGTIEGSTQPLTQRNTVQHTAQPSQANMATSSQEETSTTGQGQNSQHILSSNYLTSQVTSGVPTLQTGRVPRMSIPSSTNLTSSHVQTTNPTFSVAVNTRNSDYKLGTTGHTGTNYENGSLLQGSIDNRYMNNPQMQGALGPIMSEHEQTSSNDGQMHTIGQNEAEQIQRFENNETFSDMPNQGVQHQMFNGSQAQLQQQPENPYKNNLSNRKGSAGLASNSSNAGNHYESFQNSNIPAFQGLGFVNQQQFNTVDNRQLSDLGMPPQHVQGIPPAGQTSQCQLGQPDGGSMHVLDNMHSRTNSRSRANMNTIWQNQKQMGQQSQVTQQEGGTFYRSDRDNSYERRMLPHLSQQQRVLTSSSGQKKGSNQALEQMNSRTDTYCNNQSSGYKAGKYKNLVQHFESKFSQIRRDLPKPEFLRESDLPDESKIIEDLRVSGTDFSVFEQELATQLSRYFDELRAKSLTYQTEEELKGDVSRLMLLNDQEGLKLRFAQLYRERDNVITHAKDQIQKVHPIERQKTILQLQLSNTLRHFAQNTEQFSGYLNLIEERYQETEGELLDELREKMSVIEGLQETRNQMEETIDQLKKQFEDANSQRQEEHKHRVETDSKMKEVADENAKLRQNYDVLKEHEMSIIRDCENRKQQEIKAQQEILLKEREMNAEQFAKIEKMKQEINDLQAQLRGLEKDSQIHENEKNTFQGRSESYANEIQALSIEISSLKQKACEDIELIKIMRQNADSMKREKQELSEKILELQRAAKTNEQSADNQHQMFQKVQSEVKLLEQDAEQLRADKQAVKDQMKNLKNDHINELTQKDLVIQKVKEEMEELNRKNGTLQQLIAARNDELINIKAKQFDKVDLLQKLSETEGKLKQLEDEKDKAISQKDEVQSKCDHLQLEVNKMQQINEALRIEMEKMRQQQDHDFDQFDGKFDELNRQVERFTQENTALKDKVHQHREEVRESEKQKSYWREKCRVAEKKGDQINQKIVELENELRTIIFERNQKQPGSEVQSQAFMRKSLGADPRGDYLEERSTFNTLESGKIGFGSSSHQASARRPPLQHQITLSTQHGVKQDHSIQQPTNRNYYDLEHRPSSNAIHIENESSQAQIMNHQSMQHSPNMSRSSSASRGQQQYEPNHTKNSEPPLRSNHT